MTHDLGLKTAVGPIGVYLVEDQTMIRAAIRSLITADGRIAIVGEHGDARRAVDQIEGLQPDIVLLDISMPGLSGLDALPMIRKASPRTRVIMLTHHEGETFVEQALRAGADGYLSKDSDPRELALAIEAVHRGGSYVCPNVAAGLVSGLRAHVVAQPAAASAIASLTPREREVFQLLAVGKSNKDVSKLLAISLGTVKKHRENLQRKLACGSSAELARIAMREGLLDP